MKIAVLAGSPKGMTSVTMQYVRFLQKRFPQHEFALVQVTQDANRLEEDAAALAGALDVVWAAHGVLWAFPVYALLVPGPYKRFIELVLERGAQAAFRGKHAASLSTSIRFFDYTAHDYLAAVSEDLGMDYVGAYSAEMYDLLKPEERDRLAAFAEAYFRAIEEHAPMPRRSAPAVPSGFRYAPGPAADRLDLAGKRLVVLADLEDPGSNLARMVGRFAGCFAAPVEVVDLREVRICGGCMGCIRCSLDNVCVLREADDVHLVYQKLMAADVLVFAGQVRDRYLSARWKLFWDRGFFHNHVPMFAGKQIGWLVSGALAQAPNLRQILEAGAELQQANLSGLVSDECGDSARLDQLIDGLARGLVRDAARGYCRPPSFFGVAGTKIFRDEIWSSLRFVFQADHRYYKEHGLYRFPRRSLKRRVQDAWYTLLLKLPSFRREFQNRLKQEMVRPLEKVLEDE